MNMHLSLQEAGNLVMFSDKAQQVKVWESNTPNLGGKALRLTDEGGLQVVDQLDNVVWSDSMMPNNIWKGPAQNQLKQGESLRAQQFIRSENGRFVCLLRDDLELQVLMKTKEGEPKQIWSSGKKNVGMSLGKAFVS